MKEIELLEVQIEKLNNKDFDFKVWKQYSIMLLSRIFGDDDQKVKQISVLDIDYSSWSLRDASGRTSQIDTLKKIGKEILQVAIEELRSFGLPVRKSLNVSGISADEIILAMENELKISQLKELIHLINSEMTDDIKKIEIVKMLQGCSEQASVNILGSILTCIKPKGTS
jgi:hypothetical protein